MTYQDLVVALSNAQQWASLAALTLIAVGIYLALAPINECSECVHCRQQRAAASTWCPQHRKPRHECRDEHRP
jgi:hypothetical protein